MNHVGRFRDKLFNTSAQWVRGMAFQAISRTQNHPEAIMLAFALNLLLMCDKYGIRVQEVMDHAARVKKLSRTDDPTGHFGACVEYIKHELPDG